MRFSTRSLCFGLISSLLFGYQFLPALHFFAPATLFGKNLYTIAPALVCLLLLGILWPGIRRTALSARAVIALGALAYLWILVFCARSAFYAENGDLLSQRYLLILFVYNALLMCLTNDLATRNRVATLLIAATATQAIIGIIHAHLFPFVQLVADDEGTLAIAYDALGTREVGTLVSSSTFASVIVCGQFVLLGERRLSFIFRLFLTVIMVYAVVLSASRYPMAISFALAAGFVLNNRMKRSTPLVLAVIGFAIAAWAFVGQVPVELQGVSRFSEDSGGRFDKLALTAELMTSDWRHMLIGVPDQLVRDSTTPSGLPISDNSYGLIAMQFGVPVLLTWLVCVTGLIVRKPLNWLTLFAVAYFLLNLALTNSILWEPWLFYFVAAMWVVRRYIPTNCQDWK